VGKYRVKRHEKAVDQSLFAGINAHVVIIALLIDI